MLNTATTIYQRFLLAFRLHRPRAAAFRLLYSALFAFGFSALTAAPAYAQAPNQRVPEHAYSTGYSDLWSCHHGYARRNEACEVVAVPENARLTARGDRWECLRTFRNTGEACIAMTRVSYSAS